MAYKAVNLTLGAVFAIRHIICVGTAWEPVGITLRQKPFALK